MGIEERGGMPDRKLSHRLYERDAGPDTGGYQGKRRRRLRLYYQFRFLGLQQSSVRNEGSIPWMYRITLSPMTSPPVLSLTLPRVADRFGKKLYLDAGVVPFGLAAVPAAACSACSSLAFRRR